MVQPQTHRFTLRHMFARGLDEYPDLHRRLDIPPVHEKVATTREDGAEDKEELGSLEARSSPEMIQRLANRRVPDVRAMLEEAQRQGIMAFTQETDWAMEDVPGPNVTDRDTVLNLALMAADAYNENRDDPEWTDVGPPFNRSSSFGWQKDSLRGHVFADDTNSTIVIAIKGTSSAVFDGAGTTTNDKVNDNLFFSCCCGEGGHYLWLKVCTCMTSTYTCNENCVVSALRDKSRYYSHAIELYGNITELYPNANVWLTGHSLGGAVSSLLGLTFGLPVVTFEGVPDAWPAKRLGLPIPPGTQDGLHQRRQHTGAHHFGHTADPVYMGVCNAATSVCTLAFYAMESVCHTGRRCVWDTVADFKWRVSMTTHRIRSCIPDVYQKYDHLPKCEPDAECVDCGAWKFFRGNGSEGTAPPTTSTSSVSTRTETCKTPGWWGCLDESSTTSTTVSTTFTTTTCSSYGWFGNCLDPITTTVEATWTLPASAVPIVSSTSTVPTATSTCETPGLFFGCYDAPTSAQPGSSSSVPLPSTSTCHKSSWFWGCLDDEWVARAAMITAPP